MWRSQDSVGGGDDDNDGAFEMSKTTRALNRVRVCVWKGRCWRGGLYFEVWYVTRYFTIFIVSTLPPPLIIPSSTHPSAPWRKDPFWIPEPFLPGLCNLFFFKMPFTLVCLSLSLYVSSPSHLFHLSHPRVSPVLPLTSGIFDSVLGPNVWCTFLVSFVCRCRHGTSSDSLPLPPSASQSYSCPLFFFFRLVALSFSWSTLFKLDFLLSLSLSPLPISLNLAPTRSFLVDPLKNQIVWMGYSERGYVGA